MALAAFLAQVMRTTSGTFFFRRAGDLITFVRGFNLHGLDGTRIARIKDRERIV